MAALRGENGGIKAEVRETEDDRIKAAVGENAKLIQKTGDTPEGLESGIIANYCGQFPNI